MISIRMKYPDHFTKYIEAIRAGVPGQYTITQTRDRIDVTSSLPGLGEIAGLFELAIDRVEANLAKVEGGKK